MAFQSFQQIISILCLYQSVLTVYWQEWSLQQMLQFGFFEPILFRDFFCIIQLTFIRNLINFETTFIINFWVILSLSYFIKDLGICLNFDYVLN